MPESGHLDGYPGEGCQAVLLVGATTYLYDTELGGGNYVYWPASHNLAHRYFRQYPDRIEGTLAVFRTGIQASVACPGTATPGEEHARDGLLFDVQTLD